MTGQRREKGLGVYGTKAEKGRKAERRARLGGDEGLGALLGKGDHLLGLVLEHERAAHEVRLDDVRLHQ